MKDAQLKFAVWLKNKTKQKYKEIFEKPSRTLGWSARERVANFA